MEKTFCVYILASKFRGTLYIGISSDLLRRVDQHKKKLIKGFTSKYNVNNLVYFECGQGSEGAILREKELKRWRREWKIALIEGKNPNWTDLYPQLIGIGNKV